MALKVESWVFQNFLHGDKSAFKLLAKHCFNSLFQYAIANTKSSEISRSIIRESLNKAWQNRHLFKNLTSFERYLNDVVEEGVLAYLQEVAGDTEREEALWSRSQALGAVQPRLEKDREQEFTIKNICNDALQLQLIPKLGTTEG